MRLRREFLKRGLAAGTSALLALGESIAAAAEEHVKGVTAITQVFGEGQKFVAVAVEYDQDIVSAKLSTSSFRVDRRTVTKVYANTTAALAERGRNGRYVIVELSPQDPEAQLYILSKGAITRVKAQASVIQTGPIATRSGSVYAASSRTLSSSGVINLIVDDFQQLQYKDPNSGATLNYNLFVPKQYDRQKSYPLVLFMHDAGVVSQLTDTTLIQGLGAVVWASPADQAKREAFVLAPQYPSQPSGGGAPWPYLDMTVDLVKLVAGLYNIDSSRLYTTGQSLGCSLSIDIDAKYPDLFAASFLVAGQRDPQQARPLEKDKLWIVVSQGDLRAYPGENAMTQLWEQDGARISRAVWNGRSSAAEFAAAVEKMEAEDAPIKYVALEQGTVVLPGQADEWINNHLNTWRIAYGIEGIRDWLFRQRRTTPQQA